MATMFPYRRTSGAFGAVRVFGSGGASSITAANVGELNAGLIAKQVEARTGIPTSADDIIARAMAHRIYDDRGGTDPRSQALWAMATKVVGASSAGEAISAIRPLLDPLYTQYGPSAANGKLIALLGSISGTGADTALASAALDIATSVFNSETVQGLLDSVSDVLGNASWLTNAAATIGEAVSQVANAMPYLAAVSKFSFAMADYVTTLWGPIRGDIVGASRVEWSNFSAQLYARLANEMGFDVGTLGAWSGSWNPFFYEVFLNHIDLEALDFAVRALDIHQFNLAGGRALPRWREVLTSAPAVEYARANPRGLPLPPGLNAEFVAGCNDYGYQGLEPMVRPYRWYQNQAAFRSAVLASMYVNGQVCCIRGLGEWVTSCRGIAGYGEDDYICYNDNSPFYALGYPFKSARGKSWWATWGGSIGLENKVYVIPPSVFPDVPSSVRGRTSAIRSWANTELRKRAYWTPLDAMGGNRDLPREGTSGATSRGISRSGFVMTPKSVLDAKSSIPAVAVVGGLGAAGLIAWLLLK